MPIARELKDVWALGGLTYKELLWRLVAEIQKDNSLTYAAALAYYFFFAIFPFFLFLTALLGYLPVEGVMEQILELLANVLTADALRIIEENVAAVVSQQRGGLLSIGIAFALWTASTAVAAIADALNHSYNVEETRPYWKVRLMAILLTIGISVFVITSIVLLMFGPQIGGWIANMVGLGRAFEITWNIVRWPVILFLVTLGSAMIYYFTPDVEQDWKWITPGSVFAVALWILASLGFSYYVNNFGEYDATYGSIGAIIVLLTWMYVSGLVILVGGEINAIIEHSSEHGKDPGEKTID